LKKIGDIFKYIFWLGVGFVGLMTIINSVYGAYQVSRVTGANWLDVLTAADTATHFAAGVVIITCSLFSSLFDHLTKENDEA